MDILEVLDCSTWERGRERAAGPTAKPHGTRREPWNCLRRRRTRGDFLPADFPLPFIHATRDEKTTTVSANNGTGIEVTVAIVEEVTAASGSKAAWKYRDRDDRETYP
jgi:hypothetical protein